jgi:small subunit ribosomal protein S11
MLTRIKIFNPKKKRIIAGLVHINATYNNTIVTMTDLKGNKICWSSAGTLGFTGTRKKTPFAAQTASDVIIVKALRYGLKRVEILVKGKGEGRDPAIRAIQNSRLKVLKVIDITLEPHNGCRSSRKRKL